jgi:hypothetical protein
MCSERNHIEEEEKCYIGNVYLSPLLFLILKKKFNQKQKQKQTKNYTFSFEFVFF